MNRLQRRLAVAVLLLFPFALWGKGGLGRQDILRMVAQQNDYVLEMRRYFHLHPELSGQEKETVKRLKAELQQIGDFDIHDVPGSTGFYAILDTGHKGRTIGLRTDIDGLKKVPLTAKGSRNDG